MWIQFLMCFTVSVFFSKFLLERNTRKKHSPTIILVKKKGLFVCLFVCLCVGMSLFSFFTLDDFLNFTTNNKNIFKKILNAKFKTNRLCVEREIFFYKNRIEEKNLQLILIFKQIIFFQQSLKLGSILMDRQTKND